MTHLNVKCAWNDDPDYDDWHNADHVVRTRCGCVYFLCAAALFELTDASSGNTFTDYWRCLKCNARQWDVVEVKPVQWPTDDT